MIAVPRDTGFQPVLRVLKNLLVLLPKVTRTGWKPVSHVRVETEPVWDGFSLGWLGEYPAWLTPPSTNPIPIGMHDRTTTLEAFLTATASKSPTPGGGSVAALAGALSTAIGRMVLSYSIGRKDLLQFEPELKQFAHEFDKARQMLLQLMVDDQEAYAELTSVRKLPQELLDRQSRVSAAVLACIRCPHAVAATGVAILTLCEQMVEIVNPWLLSDLAICADLAMATTRCALYNVTVNLSSVENQSDRDAFADESDKMLAHAKVLIQKVSPGIWSRYDEATRK